MSVLESFDHWKEFLYSKVVVAEKLGVSETNITKGVNFIQNFLAHNVEPQNPEEKLLQKLWIVGDDNEKTALSHMILKLVKEEGAPEGQVQENHAKH